MTFVVNAVLRKSGSSPRGSRMIVVTMPVSANICKPYSTAHTRVIRPYTSGNKSRVMMMLLTMRIIRSPPCPASVHTDPLMAKAFSDDLSMVFSLTSQEPQVNPVSKISRYACLDSAPNDRESMYECPASPRNMRPLGGRLLRVLRRGPREFRNRATLAEEQGTHLIPAQKAAEF